jgi:hypothetical protein
MGGTAVQHIMIGTADAIPWDTFQGVTQPPTPGVADPDPKSATDVSFQRDQAWTNCSDLTQPGITPIVNYLKTLPWHPSPNCDPSRFYMINNLSPGFLPNGNIDAASILTGSKVPPSSLRTTDDLSKNNISWAYYGGGYNAAVRVANGSTDPVDKLIASNYCDTRLGTRTRSWAIQRSARSTSRTQSIFSVNSTTAICHRSHMSSPTVLSMGTRRARSCSLRGHAREHS